MLNILLFVATAYPAGVISAPPDTPAPAEAASLIKNSVRPAQQPDNDRIKLLLTRLDADDFETRDAAERELAHLGEATEPALRETLAGKPSAELRSRCERLLESLAKGELDADGLRRLRAVQVLEHIGSPEARTVSGSSVEKAGSKSRLVCVTSSRMPMVKWLRGRSRPHSSRMALTIAGVNSLEDRP